MELAWIVNATISTKAKIVLGVIEPAAALPKNTKAKQVAIILTLANLIIDLSIVTSLKPLLERG